MAIATVTQLSNGDVVEPKAKVVTKGVEVEYTPAPPVADDFMYDFKYNHALPTTDVLGAEIPADCDVQKEAEAIVHDLSKVMGNRDAPGFAEMFLEYGKSATAANMSNC